MVSESYIEFQSFYGCSLKNLFLSHKPRSESLVVLFPGRGYTCDLPLLYYASMAASFKGCDVLNLEYGFYKSGKSFEFTDFNSFVNELGEIIKKCSPCSYLNVYFISKSLGTLFAGEITSRMKELRIKNLFLTPIEKTLPYVLETGSTVITGSRDNSFPLSCIDTARKSNAKIIVVDGADHSLETEISILRNLEILTEIVTVFENFIS